MHIYTIICITMLYNYITICIMTIYNYIYINGGIKVFVTKHWIKKANTSIQCGIFMN